MKFLGEVKNHINLTIEQAESISKWADINKEKLSDNIYPIFEKAMITIETKGKILMALYVNIDKIHKLYILQNSQVYGEIKYDENTKEFYFIQGEYKEFESNTYQRLLVMFFDTFNYILYHKSEIIEKEVKKRKTSKVKGKYVYSGTTVIKNYTFEHISAKKVTKKGYKLALGAWGVRGHLRHLPNGNTIFIKPYVKGKNKDIIDKRYIFKFKEELCQKK